MKWISKFQLFLFDFDGLLVNTEHLQFQSYVNALAERGYDLGWSFMQFCALAHLNSTALREGIWAQFPELEPIWDQIYAEKKQAYLKLLRSGKIELMPGVERLLKALHAAQIRHCVVTHSFWEQVQLVRAQLPALQTIPHWVTRESYEKAKPSPDGYLRAIELYGQKGDRVIGFEDSVRGIQALRQTPAVAVLICPSHHPLLEIATEGDVWHYESFLDIPDNAF
jgi:HAD superfamily hydrolase (TIGR01509 family)